jgi:hypothetical protein
VELRPEPRAGILLPQTPPPRLRLPPATGRLGFDPHRPRPDLRPTTGSARPRVRLRPPQGLALAAAAATSGALALGFGAQVHGSGAQVRGSGALQWFGGATAAQHLGC